MGLEYIAWLLRSSEKSEKRKHIIKKKEGKEERKNNYWKKRVKYDIKELKSMKKEFEVYTY